MQVAESFIAATRRKRELDGALSAIKQDIEKLGVTLLDHIENGDIPASFMHDGARVYVREQLWAGPLDGDHAALCDTLKDVGLPEFLPRTVNSQTISAYVREHFNAETGEVEGLDPRLLAALNISTKTTPVVNFGG